MVAGATSMKSTERVRTLEVHTQGLLMHLGWKLLIHVHVKG